MAGALLGVFVTLDVTRTPAENICRSNILDPGCRSNPSGSLPVYLFFFYARFVVFPNLNGNPNFGPFPYFARLFIMKNKKLFSVVEPLMLLSRGTRGTSTLFAEFGYEVPDE